MDFGQRSVRDGWMLSVTPKVEFSDRNFTKREIAILKNLAEEYKNSDADEMVEATHLENLPWDQIYVKQGAKQSEIPYSLALRRDEADEMMRIAEERKELLEQP